MDKQSFLPTGKTSPPAMTGPAVKRRRRVPMVSVLLLAGIILGCLCCPWFIPKDPTFMDLANCSVSPNGEFWFGTDTMGRDIFSMIWHGGRPSLFIGFFAAVIAAGTGMLFGTLSGLAPAWLDTLLMRAVEILLSIPNLLLVVFIRAILGGGSVPGMALVIGMTSWMSIAKVVRTEVKQLRSSGYVTAAKRLGGGFFHILWRHLAPNFIPSILFMAVMNIRSAIAAEATLSFMGLGLPLETISWGSMLSLAQGSLLSGNWWIIFIPGVFLISTMLCITHAAHYLRDSAGNRQSNL